MDVSEIFQAPPGIQGYGDELAAIKSNHKAMSVFTGRRGDAYFEAIEKEALDLELVLVTLTQDTNVAGETFEQVSLFVTNLNNIWRVRAYISFLDIMYRYPPWSNGAEHFQSFLLGYSDEKISEWMKYKRDIQLAWGACTIYFFATAVYFEKLKLLGNRCFHPECDDSGIALFIPKKHLVLKPEAHQLLPVGTMIGRLAVSWSAVNDLIMIPDNGEQGDFSRSTLSPQSIPAFNSSIRSPIEFFSANGWT
jgi:hypothetical protein